MKKVISILLAVTLCAALCACGAAPASAPEATAAPAAETTATPVAEVTATPVSEEPTAEPTAEPTPAPQGEKNGVYDALCDLYDNYHPGTAGSSLKLVAVGAAIMDEYMENGAEACRNGSLAIDWTEENEFGETLHDKMGALYASALSLYGFYGQSMLDSCGYAPRHYGYTTRDVHKAFAALYEAWRQSEPVMIAVYASDDNAEHFRVVAVAKDHQSAVSLSEALRLAAPAWWGDAGTVEYVEAPQDRIAVDSLRCENGTVYVDINEDYRAMLLGLGTSGEYMVIGGLVNTVLGMFDAENVVLTVGGAPLETGHNVYDQPLTFFEDNV